VPAVRRLPLAYQAGAPAVASFQHHAISSVPLCPSGIRKWYAKYRHFPSSVGVCIDCGMGPYVIIEGEVRNVGSWRSDDDDTQWKHEVLLGGCLCTTCVLSGRLGCTMQSCSMSILLSLYKISYVFLVMNRSTLIYFCSKMRIFSHFGFKNTSDPN
jgi:hypothetical protein